MATLQQRLSTRGSSIASSSSVRPSLPARTRRSVAVKASAAPLVPLPKGVSAPKRTPQAPEPRFGFVYNAERLNSRACMIGFIGTLIVEGIAHKGVLEMLGFTVGQGLGFEF